MSNHDAANIDRRWNAGDFNAALGGITRETVFKMPQDQECQNPRKSRSVMVKLSPSTGINADAASLEEFQAWLP